jgi:hypothetical protein
MTEADSYAALSCIPSIVEDRAEALAAYCVGWRAVRRGW